MKEKFRKLIFPVGLLLVLFLLINLFHLIWYIADPEGFWGFAYFLELLRVGLFVLIIAVFAFFLIILLFSYLVSSFRNGFNKKAFLKGLGILAFVLTVPLVNYLFSNGPIIYITGSLADKYSHLRVTEEFLEKGEITAACEYAEKAYHKEMDRGEIPSFFFLSKWYSHTDIDKSRRLTSKYAAIISYGLCLKESSGAKEEAEALFKEAVRISRSELLQGEKTSFLSFPLMALAEINLQKGEYLIAEKYFERLENFYGELTSEDIRYQIKGRMFFADRAIRVGNFEKAAKIHLQNVQLFEQNFSNENSQLYLGLLVMASLTETYLGNYQKAKELLFKANPVAEENDDKLLYPSFLTIKAKFLYHAAINDLDASELISRTWWEKIMDHFREERPMREQLLMEAESLYKAAVAVTAEKVGLDSYQYLTKLRQLGEFYYNTGKNKQAEKIFGKVEEILRPVKNEIPDFYNDILLASLKTRENINYPIISEIEDQIFRRISANFLFLTKEEKESFIAKTENQLHLLNSIYVRENTPRANKQLYNNILATKQLALNSSKHLRQFISQAPEELKKEYAELLQEKEKLLSTTNRKEYQGLSSEIADKERKLHLRIAQETAFSPFEPRDVNWVEVRNALGENEVAIEMFKLTVRKNLVQDDADHYFALVLKREFDYPRIIPLFKEEELEKLLNKDGGTRERVNAIYGIGKEELLEMIWEPLAGHVKNSSGIFLSVSGILHQISFPALMLDQPWEFHLLGSTRDISKVKSSSGTNEKNIALFGDADFNSINEDEQSRSFHPVDQQIEKGLDAGYYSDLQYTRQEVNAIEKIFKPLDGKLIKLLGKEASEESFRDLNFDDYNIVHLATHGFYFKANVSVVLPETNLINNNFVFENPMYRSGILLAGEIGPSDPKDSDGIITAFEISKMDLSGVDLMVLSACETARGDISGGEGVFGLQRALKLAGVKNQIVSLWQVPDRQTAELFEIFYEHYSLGSSAYISLKLAQAEMAKKYAPFYWAGFVLLE